MIDEHITIYSARGAVQLAGAQTTGNNVVITNEGSVTVYVGGGAVTANNGLPIIPGGQLDIPTPAETIYGITDPGAIATLNAVLSSQIAIGQTSLPVDENGDQFTGSMTILIEDGNATETVYGGSGSTSTSIILQAATRFPHNSGVTVVELQSSQQSQVHVITGN